MKRSPIKRKARRRKTGDDPKYLRWIREQPCVVPGCAGGWWRHIEAAHFGRRSIGLKPPDNQVLPLCASLDYRDYLKTPWWRFMRYTKLEIAGASCQLCSAEQRQIDIHHRTYERLGDEDLDDLTVLCRNCHAKFHGKVHS